MPSQARRSESGGYYCHWFNQNAHVFNLTSVTSPANPSGVVNRVLVRRSMTNTERGKLGELFPLSHYALCRGFNYKLHIAI